MLKFDTNQAKFEKLTETELKSENILERYDLQKAIANSWEYFKNEIGFPSAFLIGQEINPHNSTGDSLDLLAFDPEDSSMIVIELKRGRNKLHLLQALSYAGMISKWTGDDLIEAIQKDLNPEPEELVDIINANPIGEMIKIILIAESFDPEVVLTADWLSSNYGLDITAFAINLYKMRDDHFVNLEQRYPLKDIADSYESRKKSKSTKTARMDVEWEDVIPKMTYPFAQRGVDLCKKISAGDPSRRRFGGIRKSFDNFKWISLNFRQKYINVYMKGDIEEPEEFFKEKFHESITVNTWCPILSINSINP